MAEYINREAVVKRIEVMPLLQYGIPKEVRDGVIDLVKIQPAADVAPVVHGRWDDSGRYTFPGGAIAVRCTECGCALTASEYHLQNWYYCPVCGAKMDGGAEHEAD